jgi:hypothetical protein
LFNLYSLSPPSAKTKTRWDARQDGATRGIGNGPAMLAPVRPTGASEGNPPVRERVKAEGRSVRFRMRRHGMAEPQLRAIATWALCPLRSRRAWWWRIAAAWDRSAGRVRLHKDCREFWHVNRRVKAIAALADLGISPLSTAAINILVRRRRRTAGAERERAERRRRMKTSRQLCRHGAPA